MMVVAAAAVFAVCILASFATAQQTPWNSFQQWTEDLFNGGHQEHRHVLPLRSTLRRELEEDAWEDLSKDEKKQILQQKQIEEISESQDVGQNGSQLIELRKKKPNNRLPPRNRRQ